MTGTTFRSDLFNAFPKDPASTQGKKNLSAFFRKTVTSGTSAIGDIFILGGPYTMDDRVLALLGEVPALTSANDCDFGFYKKKEDGTFVVAVANGGNELIDAADLSSAIVYKNQLLALNTALDSTKNIGDLLSLTQESCPPSGIYVGVLFNVANTAASAIVNWELVVEQANTK